MKKLNELKQVKALKIDTIGSDGGHGILYIGGMVASVIWSFDGGWEHVSVSPRKMKQVPSWDYMCKLKDIFFYDEEVVVQFHPAKSQYVNQLPNCLHLWRPIKEKLPVPPSIMVGVRDGQSAESIDREMKELSL